MDQTLEHLFEMLEMNCEDALNAYQPYRAWPEIQKRIQEIKDYLATKDITDSNRKCTDKTHFKGCDCW